MDTENEFVAIRVGMRFVFERSDIRNSTRASEPRSKSAFQFSVKNSKWRLFSLIIMKLRCAFVALTGIAMATQAQQPIPLWPAGAPGALGQSSNDIPTITAFLPPADNAPSAAIVVCPGAGYAMLVCHGVQDYELFLDLHGLPA